MHCITANLPCLHVRVRANYAWVFFLALAVYCQEFSSACCRLSLAQWSLTNLVSYSLCTCIRNSRLGKSLQMILYQCFQGREFVRIGVGPEGSTVRGNCQYLS